MIKLFLNKVQWGERARLHDHVHTGISYNQNHLGRCHRKGWAGSAWPRDRGHLLMEVVLNIESGILLTLKLSCHLMDLKKEASTPVFPLRFPASLKWKSSHCVIFVDHCSWIPPHRARHWAAYSVHECWINEDQSMKFPDQIPPKRPGQQTSEASL